MSLPCPKCGGHNYFREVITKNPPAEDLVYRCCSQRRHFYYDSLYGWESQDQKRERLERILICRHCKKPFTQPSVMTETKKIRSTCDKCRAKLQRLNHQSKESHEQIQDI